MVFKVHVGQRTIDGSSTATFPCSPA